MKKILSLAIIFALWGAGVAANPSGGMQVTNIRLAAAVVDTRPTAIFLTLQNQTEVDDRLRSVSTPVCGRAELHDHQDEKGVMKMRQVPEIAVPAGAIITLKPMGLHVMCFDPVLPQKVGESFTMTLNFENAGAIQLTNGRILPLVDLLREVDADTP